MLLKKSVLPRRSFLRGIGAAMALPFLDAMVPAGTAMASSSSWITRGPARWMPPPTLPGMASPRRARCGAGSTHGARKSIPRSRAITSNK